MLSYMEDDMAILYLQMIAKNLMHSWDNQEHLLVLNSYFILMLSVLEQETSLPQS